MVCPLKLFIMYINDLPSVTRYCKVHIYADDTLLFFESSSVQDIEAALFQDLSHVVGWLNQKSLEDQSYANGNSPRTEFSPVIYSQC